MHKILFAGAVTTLTIGSFTLSMTIPYRINLFLLGEIVCIISVFLPMINTHYTSFDNQSYRSLDKLTEQFQKT